MSVNFKLKYINGEAGITRHFFGILLPKTKKAFLYEIKAS